MRANYEQLGIAIEPAKLTDLTGVVDVQARTFVDTYHTEDHPIVPPNSPAYMSKDVLERFVFRSDFLERKIDLWRRRIEGQTEDDRVLVARYGNTIVGFSNTALDEQKGSINALFILPEFQHRYIGKALIADLIERSDTREVHLDVVDNTPAVGFYKHFGFNIMGVVPPEQCPEMKPGKWLTLLAMKRQRQDTNSV